MLKYGIVQGGKLIESDEPMDGYKPVQYAEIPDGFDQLTQCVVQSSPLDDGSVIIVGVEIKDVTPNEDVEMNV